MRRTSFSAWLLVAAVAGILVASRFGRALGPTGAILTVVLVVAGVLLVRDLIQTAWLRQGPPDRPATPPKNVTPHEPALTPGAGTTAPPTSEPSVIVIEPPDETEQLAAKLRALEDLRAGGLVTDDEYEAKRARLIADF